VAASLLGVGAAAFGTTTATPAAIAGVTLAEGDTVFLLVVSKLSGVVPVTPAGWIKEFEGAFGTGADAAGAGLVRLTVFSREVPASGTLTMPAVGTGTNVVGVVPLAVRPDAGQQVVWNGFGGSDTTAATSWSVTASANPGLTSGDVVAVLTGVTGSTPLFNAFSLAATGATISALAEAVDNNTTLGNDMRVGVHTGTVTAGTATAAPVFTATLSSATGATGGSLIMRFRSGRRNRSINPALAVDTNQWFGGAGEWARATGVTGFTRTTSWRGTNVVGETVTPKADCYEGVAFAVSVSVRTANAVAIDCNINWYNAAGAYLASGPASFYNLVAGQVTRIGAVTVAPAGAVSGLLAIHFPAGSGQQDITEHLAEVATTLDTFFDGATATAAWYGTTGASQSYISPPATVPQTGSDSAALTEGTGLVADGWPATDSATLNDATSSVTAALDGVDTGALSEAPAVLDTFEFAVGVDTATLTESAVVVVFVDGLDQLTATEAGDLVATLAGSDTATAGETGPAPSVFLDGLDAATVAEAEALALDGSDTVGVGEDGATTAQVAGSDAATMVEDGAVFQPLTGTDALALAEAGEVAAALDSVELVELNESAESGANLADVDAFAFAEEPAEVAIGEFRAGTDTATLTEAGSLAAVLDGAESAALAEAGALVASVAGSDVAALTEVADQPPAALDQADTAALAEVAALAADLVGADSAALVEVADVNQGETEVDGTDAATLTEAGTVTAAAAGVDTGAVAESAALAAGLAGADAAGLVDGGELVATAAGSDDAALDAFEFVTVLGEAVSASDTATLAESAALVVLLDDADGVELVEVAAGPAVQVVGSDGAALTEVAARFDSTDAAKLPLRAGAPRVAERVAARAPTRAGSVRAGPPVGAPGVVAGPPYRDGPFT
jgi:hypothetical protein